MNESLLEMETQWNWTFICPTGLKPWSSHTKQLAPCFQQIFFQLPTLVLFSILSAYHFGRRHRPVVRNNIQKRVLYVRLSAVLVMAVYPFFKYYMLVIKQLQPWPIDVLVGGSETVAFTVHFGLLLSLRKFGGVSHRGSLFCGVIWIAIFLLSGIWVTTDVAANIWPWSLIPFVMHIVYAATLLPTGKATIRNSRNFQDDERQALLGQAYIRFQDDIDEVALGRAQDEASLVSRLIFYWVNPLIKKGMAGYLRRIDDLFMLPESLIVSRLTERLRHAIDSTRTLLRALHKSHGFEFYSIGVLRLIADMSGFAGPLLLGGLLTHGAATKNSDDSDDGEIDAIPYIYALGLFGTTLLSAVCGTHFNWRMSMITMKMRIGLVSAIYSKTLESRNLHNSKPDILNLMSTDTDRIVNSCISFHSVWSIPFQLFITLYLLYTQIGSAFMAGVIFAAGLIPLNRWIAGRIGVYSQQLMAAKDSRISVTSEALANAKHIKLLAWEDVFIEKITGCRRNELKYLSKRKYLDALCVYFWATTPVLMCLLTFGVSVLTGHPLTAATTFTTVALLNMLIGPLNTFPWVLNGIIEAWISLKRVQELLDLPNIDLASYYSPLVPQRIRHDDAPIVMSLENATLCFDRLRCRDGVQQNNAEIVDFRLNALNMDVKKGDLVCLEGPVGGGKSSVLAAILAELSLTDGQIFLSDISQGFGYVGQNAWLQRGTIRENIIWGAVYDEFQYRKVLMACALNEDILLLGGDHTGVGEGGRTLSGGQRARVALARAIYQDKQIYLLDDILSALDTHVASHVVRHCILGLLKGKTRIIVTDHRTLFFNANRIFHVEDGTISAKELNNSFDSDVDGDLGTDESTGILSMELIDDGVDKHSVDSIMMEESKEYGTLSMDVFRSYWRSTGGFLGLSVVASVVLMQVTRNLSDVWLANWVSTQDNSTAYTKNLTDSRDTRLNDGIFGYYLEVYASIAVANSLITLLRAFLFAYAGIKAAKCVHVLLLDRVFSAKFQFFDVTPLGRILNRFSSDTYTIDDSLPFIMNILLAQLAGLLGSLCISLYAMPWLALLIVPLCPVYLSLQHRYRQSSRDIKRLSSNALSPLYEHFTETLQGLTTIRAMSASKRFKRDFLAKLEECIRAQLTAAAAQQWLAIRLQFFGAFLVGGAGLVAAITSAHASSPGMVGLAISYALSITGLLGGVLSALAETEQEMVAVERVDKYCQLAPEINAAGTVSPPFGWPCQGVVNFKDACLKYRNTLSPSLVDINFESEPCERIGIVGRTGAGKTSILSALMRVAPLSHGELYIDCVDIATLPLKLLRSRIALVPQQPFLFSGTIRENMDPRALHLDSQIWTAINSCLATPLVQSLGGLNGQLTADGNNLSAGQKQLLCLARAMLRNSKIVCIDEGTANLDSESEIAIEMVMRSAFKSSTVILIAHRINSLLHTNRIFVMDGGRIVEHGATATLSSDSSSLFYAMLQNQRIKNVGTTSLAINSDNDKLL